MNTLDRKTFWTMAHGIEPDDPTGERGEVSAADLAQALYEHFAPEIPATEIIDTLIDPRAAALDFSGCTCEEGRSGCMDCWHRAESLIGARIRDSHGREWTIENVDEKDDSITVGGASYWMHFWDLEGGGAELLAMPDPEPVA
jgi:hypothetical protein